MATSDLEARIDRAYQLHHSHYSCAQAVACAMCDLVNLDYEVAFDTLDGFGGGMGGYDQTCGAVSGGVMILGFGRSDGSAACTSKRESYRICHELCARIMEHYEFDTVSCAEMRPHDQPPEVVFATCDDYIARVVEVTYQLLEENGLLASK